jgi:hypothetical protein
MFYKQSYLGLWSYEIYIIYTFTYGQSYVYIWTMSLAFRNEDVGGSLNF